MTIRTPTPLVVCGLPSSGKTTFLAALWHLVQSQEIETSLRSKSLVFGDYEYVNSIRKKWQKGQKQERTVGSAQRIGLDLESESGNDARLVFLDHSGETFDRLWETRACSYSIADQLRDREGILLFVRSEGMKAPVPLFNMLRLEEAVRDALPGESGVGARTASEEREWSEADAPDQVKVVDLLQTLCRELKMPRQEKLAIIVSAWDRVQGNDSAEEFVAQRLPMLAQYLRCGDHNFEYRFYGVSAQGGEYVEEAHDGDLPSGLAELLTLEQASTRILILDGDEQHHDLTIPIQWLTSRRT